MPKQHPAQVILIEQHYYGCFVIAARETTNQGLKAGEALILDVFDTLELARAGNKWKHKPKRKLKELTP